MCYVKDMTVSAMQTYTFQLFPLKKKHFMMKHAGWNFPLETFPSETFRRKFSFQTFRRKNFFPTKNLYRKIGFRDPFPVRKKLTFPVIFRRKLFI